MLTLLWFILLKHGWELSPVCDLFLACDVNTFLFYFITFDPFPYENPLGYILTVLLFLSTSEYCVEKCTYCDCADVSDIDFLLKCMIFAF